KLGGYIANGYEVEGHDALTDEGGNVLGFRLRLKDADGNPIEQDVAVGDVGGVIARFLNPDSAWASQQAARAETAKDDREVDVFRRKEEVKRDVGGGKAVDMARLRNDAIKRIEEREADPMNPNAP